MKVLFFLEPFPVRGRPLDLLAVLERWEQLAKGLEQHGVTTAFVTSDAVARARPAFEFPVIHPRALGFAPAVAEEPAPLDSQWVELMRSAVSPWRHFIDAALDLHRPDVVVTWTPNAPLRASTRRRHIPLLHQELSPLRGPELSMFCCDPQGLSAASAVRAAWPMQRARVLSPVEDRRLDDVIEELLTPPLPTPLDLIRELAPDPARRTLAVFLQAPRDSDVLTYSRVPSGRGLLHLVASAVDPTHHEVLVKLHPADVISRADVERLGFRAVRSDLPSMALVRIADAVLTLNGNVGLEALVHEKPVYTFGASIYSGLGCTRDSGIDPALLRAMLHDDAAFVLGPDERATSRRLLYFMLFHYLFTARELFEAEPFIGYLDRAITLTAANASLEQWFAADLGERRLSELRTQRRAAHLAARAEPGLHSFSIR